MTKPQPPKYISHRAERLLERWHGGSVRARKTHRYRYLSITVSPGWRLLSKDQGVYWALLSHADYDKQI